MNRVLVTGAGGFIGRHCLSSLIERGYEVHAVGLHRHDDLEAVVPITWHRADLLSNTARTALFEHVRPSHLLQLAWYTEPGKYWNAIDNLSWAAANSEMMRLFTSNGGQRAVFAGTCAEYEWRHEQYSETSTPCYPSTLYGACKHANRLMFDAWREQSGISGAWGRIFFTYGPFEHPTRLVHAITAKLLQNLPAACTQGAHQRDFMYIQDVADAFVALLDSPVTGCVNIASGTPIAVRDIVSQVGDHLGRSHLIQFGALPDPSEPPRIYADVTRLKNEVGFSTRVDLKRGIAKTIEWVKQRGITLPTGTTT